MIRNFLFCVWLLVLPVVSSFAAVIEITEAGAHAGEEVTIRGTVVQVKSIAAGMTFLNFGQRHPNAAFTAVVRQPDASWGELSRFEGQEVEVSGVIEIFKERPQIVLKTPDGIRLTEDPANPDASAPAAASPAITPVSTPSPTASTPPPARPAPSPSASLAPVASSSETFQVPLTPEEIKMAKKSPKGIAPTEATVGVRLPPGFDPSKPQRVLVVFATDDGGGAHVQALPRFASVANQAGWVAIAANGPVLENDLSPEWHAAMILAGLRALGEKYPKLKTWAFFPGGNSGGAARSSMMTGALLAEGYDVRGCFMGGAGGERFSTGLNVFRASKPKMKKVRVFLSRGTQDHIVSQEMSDSNARAIQGVGLKDIQRDSYEGGHGMNEESLRKALAWFEEGK